MGARAERAIVREGLGRVLAAEREVVGRTNVTTPDDDRLWAPADILRRYQSGERDFRGLEIETPTGKSDPEFRQTVEHYIHEFERLLDDVSRGDRGPVVARNYLTSDTGKVYTMLAHAAGRFD